jgi:hypothetical protein
MPACAKVGWFQGCERTKEARQVPERIAHHPAVARRSGQELPLRGTATGPSITGMQSATLVMMGKV